MKLNLLKFTSMAALALVIGLSSCKDELADSKQGDGVKPETSKAAYPGSGTQPCSPINVTQNLPVVTVGNCSGAAGDIFVINTAVTWTSDKIWKICGNIRVQAPGTLTIEAGTIIKGDRITDGSLVIERGAKIFANGTITNPIVMTSAEPEGSRLSGDWGGLAICGNALVNTPSGTGNLEGFSLAPTPIVYGGTNNADNSGSLRFVRIEYAGGTLTADNEKNSLTLAGVGCNTRIDHVMCSYGNDDSFEWFGGSVSSKYLFSYAAKDDDFDSDFGFSGVNQFLIAYRLPEVADVSGSNAIESDGSNECNPSRTTTAIFSHVTMIGPDGQTTQAAAPAAPGKWNAAINVRRNSGIDIHNSVMVGWPVGVDVDDVTTSDNIEAGKDLACPTAKKPVRFRNNTIYKLDYALFTKYGVSSGANCGVAAANKDNILLNWNNPADGGPHYNEGISLADLNAQAKFKTTPMGGAWDRGCPNVSITDNQSLLLSYDNTPRARPIGTNVAAICQPACTGAIGAINPVSYFRGAKGAYDNGWKYYQGWLSFTPNANNYQ